MMFFIFSNYSVDLERLMYTYMHNYTTCTVKQNNMSDSFKQFYTRKPQDGIAMSKNRWLWCPCMYLLFFDPIRFFLNCDIHVKYVIKISAIYNIIIVHIPVQNFTCIITFIVHHQKFSVFCIFTLPVHALFLLLFLHVTKWVKYIKSACI